jgi:hypothetical protein
MKRKGLMRDFELKFKSIPQEVETRFNSKYHMINAFIDVYENLKEFAKVDKDLVLEVLSIDEAVLKDIIPIFKIFDTSTLILSQNNSPTIHLVIQIKRRIISNLKSITSDSEIISDLKKILTTNVEKFMKIHFIHNFALIFDPKRRDLKLLSGEQREKVKQYLAESMKSLSLKSQKSSTESSKPKKQKISLSEEFLYESEEEMEDVVNEDIFEKEIDMYINSKVINPKEPDLLKFWFDSSLIYPNIAEVAKKVLALPATQFESERNFSMSGRTLESRRCRLLPENVDYLLFIKSNHKL